MSERLRALRARLDEALFRDAPQAGRRLEAWEQALLLVSLIALAVFLQLLRIGFSASLDTLWAEDGPIFLQGALTEGFGAAVFSPYAGYLVVVPRLIGEGAGLAPIEHAAAATSILSALVVALCGLAVWHAAAGLVRNPYLRGALVVLTVLVPVAGLESIDSAAYVPWYMLFATFWLLLWRPRTTLGTVLGSLFVLATALSSPGVWFFLPLAALRALAARGWRDVALLGSYAAGALAQIPVLALNQDQAVEPLWTSDIWTAYAQRVIDGAAFGQRLGGAAWAHLGWPFLTAVLVCAGVGLAIGIWRGGPTGRWLAALTVPISLALFVVSAYQRAVGTQIMWPPQNYHGAAGRYAIVPALLLVSLALVLIDGAAQRRGGAGWRSWLAVGAVALALAGVATSFDMRDPGARGDVRWGQAVDGAAAACRAEGLGEVSVPSSPIGFGLEVPCERLVSVP